LLKIIRLHRLANNLSDLLAGRTTHPTSLVVGGFSAIPNYLRLTGMTRDLEEALSLTKEIAAVVKDRAGALPDFKRETEYVALSKEGEYALYDGDIKSSDTGVSRDYREIINEYIVPWSTAKYAKHARDSYMVGALARFNINSPLLSKEGRSVADMFGLKAPCYNPFMNTIAQMAELAHSLEDTLNTINGIRMKNERPVEIKPGKAQAFGACEVPRGLLVHDYAFDEKGYCAKANMIIPTNQNHANIQKDMEAFAPTLIGKSEKEIELALEMLVRAYDPCISCSTHYVKVSFK
jgi:coenzyme F420-reducing hydrogenase alpha subunit